MPSPPNITNIPAPRVNFIDDRTGLMSREWYRFFLNLFTLTGGGTNATSLEDLQLGPAFEITPSMFVVDNPSPDAESSIATLSMSVNDLGQSLQTLPMDFGGTVSSVNVTLATTGTDVSFSATNSTTAPVLALSIPTASATNRGALSAADWTAFNAKGSGSVTSVGQTFTGGLISVGGSPITGSGTLALTVAGTSGGIPYFSSASTWATSAVLAANALMVGGGAGVAPSTRSTGANVLTALGVNVGTAGSFVVNGGALGTPSSGTVTNLTGTASISINGTVGATTANTGAFTSLSYTTTLTGGTGIANLGSGQFYKDASGNVGFGTTTGTYQTQVKGLGQETAALTDAGNKGGSIYLQATAVGVGSGGAAFFGTTFGNATPFAAIKGYIDNGTTNTMGSLRFSTRNAIADTALTERVQLTATGDFIITSTGGLGYGTGSGGAVTQITSRATGVTLNKTNGAITMFSAAGSAVAATFTVTNSTVAATDTIVLSVKSSTNVYLMFVTAVAAGSFNVTFQTTGGVSTDAPVINFAVIKAVTA